MKFVTYNCSGFTDDKIDYINYLLSDIHVLFLQDLWLILSRHMSRHTKSLIQYCIDDDIICSGTIHVSIRKLYSYCSRINQSTSFLDHFLFSRELLKHVFNY